MRDIQHFFVAAIGRYLEDLRSRQKGRIIIPVEKIQKKTIYSIYILVTQLHIQKV